MGGVDFERRVLFLCTGNYYRSRFAEEWFNARAAERGLDWRADSAGLAPQCWTRNPGPISSYAVEGLEVRGVALRGPARLPRDVTDIELERSARVIALCEREHRPHIEARNVRRPVQYWHIEDLPRMRPGIALSACASQVDDLIERLVHEHAT